ncbi:tetratricopeptide repeat protein [Flavobacterium lindanitolerans]|jgi:tetratricopeptide (TPR) repeat protein|uniref:tetratricopeptide repeat protein n=1 Tax=Flavobacterium lindanitolerans TaxID=428988 RepID=UPI00280985C2|nr:tetratricopeptide repeat protein [Flavobacterium lindanitolerans]MDQ7961547.1 tetratricopeptide repeat protein [Flavobacterium lindanitolerans]
MHRLSRLFLLFSFIGTAPVFAQQTAIYTNDLTEYNKAVSLYNDKQYQAAQIIFEKVKADNSNKNSDIEADCAYYIANCAIRLNQANADQMMESFVEDYPTSTKQNQAYIEVAHYYFEQGKYPQSLKWFDKVDEGSLSNNDRERYNFQKGYTFFTAGNKKEATNYFNQVLNSKEYGSQAKYYLGFMAYESDDYTKATKLFDEVSGEEKYQEKMSYFQADMNFKLGKFDKAIELGKAAMAKSNALEKSELNKIIGESYFNLKKYDQAIPYLNEYKGKKGKWNNTDFYQLGYAYYKQNDYENAISQFNKIIDGQDFVAQNAYYHLGESYLKTDRKQQALNAFKNASEMAFDAKIQEDAYLNYAKLSYEIGNSYQSIPAVLNGFIEKYPNNPSRAEIETLLINSYITSKNYKEALTLLEKNKASNREAYQKVTFYRGLELYTDGNYQEALAMFKKSLGERSNARFTARATFWKAETEYVLDSFKEAVLTYKQFLGDAEAKNTPENKNIYYNLGYAYFKLKDYDQAATNFQSYISGPKDDKVRLNDAYLRLGDSYYVSSKYWPAMEAYNKAIEIKGVDADYAAYQKAISYGFVARNEKKIEELNSFIKNFPKSQLRDDALYELGNTYVAEKKTESAIQTYDKLIAEYRESSYTSKAILRQGLVYYNAEKDDQALTKLKKVVAEFPNTPEALEAVSTARLIYLDKGKVDEYATWVKTLDFVEVSDAELDNDTYGAAEKQYLQNNIKPAIAALSGYIAKFPNGINSLKANFYLAQSYFADGLENNAIPNYEFVIAKPRNEFTEQSLARLSQILLKKADYAKAVPVLKRLEAEADYPQNVTFAQSNLMKSYYEQKDYANAVVYAEKVLANAKTDDRVKSDAQVIVARSAIKINDEVKAKAAYAKLQTIAKGELAAEALFYDAYFKNKDGKFEASNTAVQKLAKDYSGYKYFGAKGLVVMAKNFYGLKDSFQANYILESVLKNFKDYPDVIEEAQKELDIIKGEEAKRNSSIQN